LDRSRAQQDDAALLVAVRAVQLGDGARFEEIYRVCFARVYAVTRSLLRDSHEAEDAVQETFLSALRALPRYRPQPGVPFTAWLLRIARNAALMRIRSSKNVVAIDPGALAARVERAGPDKLAEALSDGRLAAALAAIPPRQRQVLTLRFVLDLDGAETAIVMDTSPAAVRQLQRRALTALRQHLGATHSEVSLGEPSIHLNAA
jgi:RNA polymerase sigma-70 factor (ECF subfamily)